MMKTAPNRISVEDLLSTKGLVVAAPSASEIAQRAEACASVGRPFRMMYGETFDEGGNTVDSLKYYLFVDQLARSIRGQFGIEVRATVLIADLGVYRNSPGEEERMRPFAENRRQFALKAKEMYGCEFEVELLTDLVASQSFESRLEKTRKIVFSDASLLKMIEGTVPEDRLEKERERGFSYSLDELCTILGLDVKVGPPRERLYDNMSNSLIQHFDELPLLGVYLYPTYPIGLQYGNYMSSQPIVMYGLTPYKVGSSGMSKNRIVLGSTSQEEATRLIYETQTTLSPTKPNPVLDIAITAEMARQHIRKDFGKINLFDAFYGRQLSVSALKQLAASYLNENILRYF